MLFRLLMMAALCPLPMAVAAQPAPVQTEGVRYAEAEVERIAAQANAAFRAGRFRAALIMLRDVHSFSSAELGPEHRLTLQVLSNVAALQQVQGDIDGALSLALTAAGGLERVAGADHPDTLNALANLAQLHVARGERPAAEPLLRRVYATRKRTLGADNEATLESLLELAAFLKRDGRLREVRSDLEQAAQIARTSHGAGSPIATDLTAAAAEASGRPAEGASS